MTQSQSAGGSGVGEEAEVETTCVVLAAVAINLWQPIADHVNIANKAGGRSKRMTQKMKGRNKRPEHRRKQGSQEIPKYFL